MQDAYHLPPTPSAEGGAAEGADSIKRIIAMHGDSDGDDGDNGGSAAAIKNETSATAPSSLANSSSSLSSLSLLSSIHTPNNRADIPLASGNELVHSKRRDAVPMASSAKRLDSSHKASLSGVHAWRSIVSTFGGGVDDQVVKDGKDAGADSSSWWMLMVRVQLRK
jgi:hypothetical protein